MPSSQESTERGLRIRAVREAAGLNKLKFAEQLGVSPSYITYLEKGEKGGEPVRPSDTILFMIAHKFGIGFDWLKEGKGVMRPQLRQKLFAQIMTLPDSKLEALSKLVDSFLEDDKSEGS